MLKTLRGFYDVETLDDAETYLDELIDDCNDEDHPPGVRSLSRTLRTWRDQILAWHQAQVSNGPTESINNRIKRIGFGFRKFVHYRTRVLLYAGRSKLGPTRDDHTPLKSEEPDLGP
jgi:transposase